MEELTGKIRELRLQLRHKKWKTFWTQNGHGFGKTNQGMFIDDNVKLILLKWKCKVNAI